MTGRRLTSGFQTSWQRICAPVVLSLGLLGLAILSPGDILGPGNDAARALVQGHFDAWAYSFPLTKMLATLLTYWSGIAGGIFAPSLSIGASLGADLGQFFGLAVPACAMVGMAAFLSGTIQAPITSFVIIFEMTGHHSMLLPVMISSLTAFILARVFGARHLYQSLASSYQWLLEPSKKAF